MANQDATVSRPSSHYNRLSLYASFLSTQTEIRILNTYLVGPGAVGTEAATNSTL